MRACTQVLKACMHAISGFLTSASAQQNDSRVMHVLVRMTRCINGPCIDNHHGALTTLIASWRRYMAPELFRGECCSLASDVYALGIALWEIFSRYAVRAYYFACTCIHMRVRVRIQTETYWMSIQTQTYWMSF